MSAIAASRISSQEGEESPDFSLLSAAGPISLFCTLSLSLQRSGNFDLILLSALGLVLCTKMRMRGLFYAFLLLVIGALCKHALFLDHHLWQLGIETSVAIAFGIIAGAAQMSYQEGAALRLQATSREQTVQHLEEDLVKTRQEAQQEQIHLQEKISLLQKELEDCLSESSSLQILNDVLRKGAAKQDVELLAEEMTEKDIRLASLLQEIDGLNAELANLRDQDQLQAENEKLHKELNFARVQKEQTYLINETLARLLATNAKKNQDLEQQIASLQEEAASSEALSLDNQRWQEMAREVILERNLLQDQIREISKEKEEIQEELEAAHQAALEFSSQSRVEIERERAHLMQRLEEQSHALAILEERLQESALSQSVYVQLRKQFEEKKVVLHQTRAELFRADTALQAAAREKELEQGMLSPLEESLQQALVTQEEQLAAFKQEKEALTELVSFLSTPPASSEANRELLKALAKKSKAKVQEKEQEFPQLPAKSPKTILKSPKPKKKQKKK